jgi:hypothetical protein
VDLRGVDLNVFDFDYDLEWFGLFMSADQLIFGRYGSRDADSSAGQLSMASLRYAMQRALARHRERQAEARPGTARPARTADSYPTAKRWKENACIHCHQAYEAERDSQRAAGRSRRDDLWVYPLPENIGLSLDLDQGNRVVSVAPGSSAEHCGLRKGDILEQVNKMAVASLADVQYALHCAPAEGRIKADWARQGKRHTAEMDLRAGWRVTDISWRASLRKVGPTPCVDGEDLTAQQKLDLGLGAQRLAFRQGDFVSRVARQAGIQRNDIILGADGKALEMTARQFRSYIRLNYQPGDRIVFNILRNGQPLDVALRLPNPPAY